MQAQNEILKRRPLITGVPFYLPVSIPFTSTLNETKTVYTTPGQKVGPLEIIGGIMNLESVQGQFTLDGRPLFSSENIPLVTKFGKPDGPKPVFWYQPPVPLNKRQRIRADLLNVGAEGAGKFIYTCRQVGVEGPMAQALLDYLGQGAEDTIVLDSKFAGTALNDITANQTPVSDDDFIWRTIHTDLGGDASVRISGIDGRSWMDDFVSLWALAGRATSVISNQPMQPLCFIPAGYQVAFEFKNEGVGGVAATSGKVFLGGQRIPRR